MSGCGSTAQFGSGWDAHTVTCRDHDDSHRFPCSNGLAYRWKVPAHHLQPATPAADGRGPNVHRPVGRRPLSSGAPDRGAT